MDLHFFCPTYVGDGAEGITINIAALRQGLERLGLCVELSSPDVDPADLNRKRTHVTKGLATLPRIFGVLKDEPLRVAMGQEARRTAAQRFDWEHIADHLTEVYAGERVLDAANGRGASAHATADAPRVSALAGS